MDKWTLAQSIDLVKPQEITDAEIWASYGDRAAHVWRITVLNNGAPANLSGAAAIADFMRADGSTVTITGTISGNVASITTTQECYAAAGDVRASLRLTTADAKQTVVHATIHVLKDATDNVVVPGTAVPDLSAVLAMVTNVNNATTAANTAAGAANTAASVANSAASAASSAATSATNAAGTATTAAGAANTAAGAANTAASNANTATTNANSARDAANTAAGAANIATGAATSAATVANNAAAYAQSMAGIHVKALYATLGALQAAHPTGVAGDHYAVGTAASNVVYIWDVNTAAWVSIGTVKGDVGATGATGAAGTAATIEVYQTITGAPGSAASIANIGTPTAAQFVFNVPQGATGSQGSAGQSAYAAAQAAGYTDTAANFNADLAAIQGLAAELAAI